MMAVLKILPEVTSWKAYKAEDFEQKSFKYVIVW